MGTSFKCLVLMFLYSSVLWSQDLWTTKEATTSLYLHPPIFRDLGIEILANEESATPLAPERDGFAATASEPLAFSVLEGRMGAFEVGTLNHHGGYRLAFSGQTWDLRHFTIRVAAPPYTFELYDAQGNPWFLLTHAHPHLLPEQAQLILRHMDLEMTPWLASQLQRNDLVGQFMGSANIAFAVDVPLTATISGGCVPDFNGDVDVSLTSVTSLSQGAREPGGRVAFAISASLRNDGTADVPWLRAISPDGGVPPEQIGQHPFLVLHTYQLRNGVFRQIAQSDVKHAFFSVNSGCACPGGQTLYVGCSDTYGAGTNLNREYLAPRNEVSAFTGDWESLGSHFDGTPVDNFRDHGGFGNHDDFEHRMVAQESQFQEPDSRFFVEAWYLVKDDINIFNGMGYREFVPTLAGNVWGFSFSDSGLTLGSALDAYVNPLAPNPGEAHENLNTGEGNVRLAIRTQDLGENTFRYEFALLNLDFDRQIQSFTVPLPDNSIILDETFFDRDMNPGNNWAVTISPNAITWQAPVGNSLDWGTLYNFGFTANGEPAAQTLALGPLEGDQTALSIPSLGPSNPCLPFHLFENGLPDWPNQANVLDLVNRLQLLCD